MLDIMQAFNHPLLAPVGYGTCYTTADQYKSIIALGKTLKAIHIHDNNGEINICYHSMVLLVGNQLLELR